MFTKTASMLKSLEHRHSYQIDRRKNPTPSCMQGSQLFFLPDYPPEAGLLNKSLCLVPALGVTKSTTVRDMILVTLCCVTQVHLRH